jgi:peptide/nickel transport system permease protein
VLVLFVVSIIIFLATHALPTDPAQAILGKGATPQTLAALRKQLGLDRPLVTQYTSWLGGIVTGNLGKSLASGQPVINMLGPHLVATLCLLVVTILISVPVAIVLGAVTAIRRDKTFDQAANLWGLVLSALPEFVIAMTVVVLFSTTVFKMLPAVAIFPAGAFPLAHPREIVLPVLTLVLACVPYLYRLVRATMIDVLESEYVTMARLKGMPERIVTLRHALPNALIPVTQASALTLAYLLGGIVVVEYIFNYPGIGSLLIDATTNRDLPMIEGVSLVFAAGVVLFNLTADLCTVYLTPKLRTELNGK